MAASPYHLLTLTGDIDRAAVLRQAFGLTPMFLRNYRGATVAQSFTRSMQFVRGQAEGQCARLIATDAAAAEFAALPRRDKIAVLESRFSYAFSTDPREYRRLAPERERLAAEIARLRVQDRAPVPVQFLQAAE